MRYWTDEKRHKEALELVHILFDRARFRPLPQPSEPVGRLRSVSWEGGLWDDFEATELAASASSGHVGAAEVSEAFAFLPGPPEQPERPASMEQFDAALEAARDWSARRRRENRQTWTLILPANLDPAFEKFASRRLRVEGHDFFLDKASNLDAPTQALLADKAFLERYSPPGFTLRSPIVVIRTQSAGSDVEAAWQAVEPAFHLLRGIAELSIGYGRTQWASPPAPRTTVPHPEWVTGVGSDGGHATLIFLVEHTRPSALRTMPRISVRNFFRLARIVREPALRGSTDEVLRDGLRLYANALDARFDRWAFLGFWQVLERLTLSDPKSGAATAETERRVRALVREMGFGGSGIRHTLHCFAKTRNALAHGAPVRVTSTDVNQIKYIVEFALFEMIVRRAGLPTESALRAYYQLHSVPQTEIDGFLTAAEAISSERGGA